MCCCHYQANDNTITYSKSIYRHRDNEVKPLLKNSNTKTPLEVHHSFGIWSAPHLQLILFLFPLPLFSLQPSCLSPSLATCLLPPPPSLAHALAPSNQHPPLGHPHPSLSNTDPLPPALSALWSLFNLSSNPPPPSSFPFPFGYWLPPHFELVLSPPPPPFL